MAGNDTFSDLSGMHLIYREVRRNSRAAVKKDSLIARFTIVVYFPMLIVAFENLEI
jgi:hypothetical protein